MKKEKLISILIKFKDFPDNVFNFVNQGKIETWEKIETSTTASTLEVRIKLTKGKEKDYYNNRYDILKNHKMVTYINTKHKLNKQLWVSFFLDIEELKILYVIYNLNKNLHPGLYIPGGASIEPWKPKHWD